MSFLIINSLDNETIDDLNRTFNMALSKTYHPGNVGIMNNHTNYRELSEMRRLMEEDIEVDYDRNTY